MASIDKIKGRYLFGLNEAASIVPQAGSGNLIVTAGTGGFTYAANYVDCRTGSRFKTPFNSTPRNRTIIIVGNVPTWDQVLDGDAALRWPPTVSHAAALRYAGDLMVTWPSVGFFAQFGNVAQFRTEAGADISLGAYDKFHDAVAYRDGSITFTPQIMVLGHGTTVADNYLGMTVGRKMAWKAVSSAYSGAAPAAEPTTFGHTTYGAGAGGQAGAHVPILGYAEYSYLTKAEAIEATTEMVTLLEARGWQNMFHNPMTSE